MLVERFARCDALDMTWARFNAVRMSLVKVIRFEHGKPQSDSDEIQVQKDRANWGLPT